MLVVLSNTLICSGVLIVIFNLIQIKIFIPSTVTRDPLPLTNKKRYFCTGAPFAAKRFFAFDRGTPDHLPPQCFTPMFHISLIFVFINKHQLNKLQSSHTGMTWDTSNSSRCTDSIKENEIINCLSSTGSLRLIDSYVR